MNKSVKSIKSKRPNKSVPKWLYVLGIVPVVLAIAGWQSWSWWTWATSPIATKKETAKTVQIKIAPGTASQEIGRQLETAGLIRSSNAWKVWSLWLSQQDKQGGFKSGTYELSSDLSLPDIASQIWKGKVVQTSFTIKEGWSLKEMAAYFETQGFFSAEEFLAATREIPKDKYSWLPNDLPHLEGFLYPETYKLPSDRITPQAVINEMLYQFEQVALPVYQQHQSSTEMSLLEWVTLASIVEKESVVPVERPLIAGVFTNRLQKGMRLESDPTVEYGLSIKQTADKPLTIAQVRTPSPYNTYVNGGLPPGPIASPAVGSLEATLNPDKTEYIFFVARYDGTHVFSKTLQEHVAATNAIRRQRQSQRS
ncbi:MAG: endolytic transglycosylase MltG [Cyanosarcina radialis HA8281-LM2]|jgi:UPF0755 protein|nr:endolytic transglycosylase MltG [Cyanosarcina radialis HA8281-LM2]